MYRMRKWQSPDGSPETRGKKQEASLASTADVCDKATLEQARRIAITPGKSLPNLRIEN